jgi:hypothetical protein
MYDLLYTGEILQTTKKIIQNTYLDTTAFEVNLFFKCNQKNSPTQTEIADYIERQHFTGSDEHGWTFTDKLKLGPDWIKLFNY